jgi:predicted nucleic acid-binding protein
MSSILTDRVAFDTNVIIYALRRAPGLEPCSELFYGYISSYRLFIPLQVYIELQHNLTAAELSSLYSAVSDIETVEWSFQPAPPDLFEAYLAHGAKKGDADIAAELHAADVRWLISENRHFLSEINDLPFTVLTSAEALAILQSEE